MENLEQLGTVSLMLVALTDEMIFTVFLGNC